MYGDELNTEGEIDVDDASEHEENIVTEDIMRDDVMTEDEDLYDEENTEDPYENRITIDDINIVTEMNTSQMAIQQEQQEQDTAHTYNLRRRPTKHNE